MDQRPRAITWHVEYQYSHVFKLEKSHRTHLGLLLSLSEELPPGSLLILIPLGFADLGPARFDNSKSNVNLLSRRSSVGDGAELEGRVGGGHGMRDAEIDLLANEESAKILASFIGEGLYGCQDQLCFNRAQKELTSSVLSREPTRGAESASRCSTRSLGIVEPTSLPRRTSYSWLNPAQPRETSEMTRRWRLRTWSGGEGQLELKLRDWLQPSTVEQLSSRKSSGTYRIGREA